MYLTECIPTEIGAALPDEHASEEQFFVKGWYFRKRAGLAKDRRQFGGDSRQLPFEGLDKSSSKQLITDLQSINDKVLRELRDRPRAAVWFQHDLLRCARRLIDIDKNSELLEPLKQCIQRVALPREVLTSKAVRTATFTEIAARIDNFKVDHSLEIARESSRLFDAEFVQLWSSIYLVIPNHDQTEALSWLHAGKDRKPLPIRSIALLVQGIVAVDDHGAPCSTDLVIEARTQRLSNRAPLAFDNPTTTRDGVDLAIWSLTRRAIRDYDSSTESIPFTEFRKVDMESQDLFRDYGSRKHTTYAAQCTLCHRRSNSPDEQIAGFSALRITSNPRQATGGERRQLAETKMQRFIDKLLLK